MKRTHVLLSGVIAAVIAAGSAFVTTVALDGDRHAKATDHTTQAIGHAPGTSADAARSTPADTTVSASLTPATGAPAAAAVKVQPEASIENRLPPALKTLVDSGKVSVVKEFGAPVGFTGYLLKQGGRYTVVYGRGGYAVTGALIGPDGHNLSADYEAQYMPTPDYKALVAKIDADPTVFEVGTGGPLLYAFEDPNCIFCHRLEQSVQPLIAAGRLRVRYVMVAFLKPDSAARAAAMMSAPDKAKAMRENTATYDETAEEGGYPVGPAPGPNLMEAFQRHSGWMEEAGSTGTPTLIYKNLDDKWEAHPGYPGRRWLEKYATDGRIQRKG